MKRVASIIGVGAALAASSLTHAVTFVSFDDWVPDSVYGSWGTANASFNPTSTGFGVSSKGFGGAYANIVPNVDASGMTTVQLSATVNAGVAGFIVALGDTSGREWNYAWYGNIPGGGVDGSNDYVFTKPVSAYNFSTGAAGQLDLANLDYIHIQVDPGFNPNLVYDVVYSDLSVVGGAANLTWNNTGGSGDGSTWDVGASQNWNNGSGPAVFNNGDVVTFTAANNGHSTVNINGVVSPGSTTVNTTGAYTFNGAGGIGDAGGLTVSAGSLTLNNVNTYSGATSVAAGSVLTVNGTLPASALNVSGLVNLAANPATGILVRNIGVVTLAGGGKIAVAAPSAAANRSVIVAQSLTFGGTAAAPEGLLDLSANDMIVRATSDAAIRSLLKAGLAGTNGIASSAAATSSPDRKAIGYAQVTADGVFDGQPVAAGDVVLKYTLVGDADLNSTVNFDDLLALAQAYGTPNTTWKTGDFNYDGVTNFDDLLGIAQNYGKSALTSGEQSMLGASFSADFALAMSLVPEPASLTVFAAGAFVARRRR